MGYNRFQIGCVIVELMVSYINLTNDLLNEREFWINVYLELTFRIPRMFFKQIKIIVFLVQSDIEKRELRRKY